MRTSYLNRRSSGIRDWAAWPFCWVCFSLSRYPARWAFPLLVSSPSASIAGASLSWTPAVLGLFRWEVVSAWLHPSHGTIHVTRVYVPRFFVSSQQRFGGCPTQIGFKQECCFFRRRQWHLTPGPWTLLDIPCLLATTILDSFPYSTYLTISSSNIYVHFQSVKNYPDFVDMRICLLISTQSHFSVCLYAWTC